MDVVDLNTDKSPYLDGRFLITPYRNDRASRTNSSDTSRNLSRARARRSYRGRHAQHPEFAFAPTLPHADGRAEDHVLQIANNIEITDALENDHIEEPIIDKGAFKEWERSAVKAAITNEDE